MYFVALYSKITGHGKIIEVITIRVQKIVTNNSPLNHLLWLLINYPISYNIVRWQFKGDSKGTKECIVWHCTQSYKGSKYL